MSGQPRALVIGGSVGGLFAAHMLRSIGWDVVVFERSASIFRRGKTGGPFSKRGVERWIGMD